MKILGIVPARGGSKGVPDKNLRPLHGRSLVERAGECARVAGVLDRLIVSTDDDSIARAAEDAGMEVPFIRPADLADDQAPMIGVVLHALEELGRAGYEPDAVMLLQPTSPLRRPEHLRSAVEMLGRADSVCSVVALPKDQCPHYVMKIRDGLLEHFLPEGAAYIRRQDVPPAYRRDGTVYLTRAGVVREHRNLYGNVCVPLIIPAEESLSIDTLDQWAEAERRVSASTITVQ